MKRGSLKPAAARSALRQLAVLGLPGKMIRNALASVIQGLVANESVTILELDENANISDGWVSLPDILPSFGLYLEHFHNAREAEAYVTFHDFFRGAATIDLLHRGHGNLLGTEIYNEIWRSADTRYILRVALREGPRACAGIMLARGHGARDFNSGEIRLVESMAPYLTHALQAPGENCEDISNAEMAEGQLICGQSGKVEYATPQGRMLLHEAAEVPLTGASLSDKCCTWAMPLLKRLIGEAGRLKEGKPGGVPIAELKTACGKYTMRTWSMASTTGSGTPDLYIISIRRHIPFALKLMQCREIQAMSGREQQVCLFLAQGMETKMIARQLGISPNTVIHYIRAIFQQLDINSRHELLPRLFEPGRFTAPNQGNAV